MQRVERVDHHRQLLGRLLADRGLGRPRVRAVWDPGGVERERGDVHAAAAHEVAGDVVDDLVAVDVRVVVRRGDRERVVVELAGHERAHDEVPGLEGLVDRRRLVDAARDRLEVRDVEPERPQVAVPADDVERVVPVVVGRDAVARADVDHVVAVLVERLAELGRVQVALAVRRVLEELPVVVAVALGRLDLGGRLEVQDPLVRARIRVQPPGRADRQHQVVAGAVGEVAEDRPADAGSLVDEQHLVRDPVAIEAVLRHRLGRPDDPEHHVVVEVQRDPAGDDVALRRDGAGLRQPVSMEAVVCGLEVHPRPGLDQMGPSRRRHVVEERAPAGEPLDPEQLLGVQAPVGRPVLGVALGGMQPRET